MVAHSPKKTRIPSKPTKTVHESWTDELWARYVKTENDYLAAKRGCYVVEELGEHVCDFIETHCHYSKGRWAGQLVTLANWQRRDVIMPLYSWVRPDTSRRFRTADIWVSKKNGKSTMAAWLALYALCADGEKGAEAYCAAIDKKQASIVFSVAADIIEASPKLQKSLKVNRSVYNVSKRNEKAAWLRALSADVDQHEGLDASYRGVDEIHVFDENGRRLLEKLRYSGAARTQPLEVHTSTAGDDPSGVGYEEYEKSKSVLAGHTIDIAHFAYIAEADKDDDPGDPATHRKANPSYGITINPEEMMEEWEKAQGNPRLINAFLRYRLGLWVNSDSPWLDMEQWIECGGAVDVESLAGRSCFAGVDLAENRDMTAKALCFPPESEGDPYIYTVHFWLPKADIVDKGRRDGVDYAQWAREGWLTLIDGNTMDNAAIEHAIIADSGAYDLQAVHYDRYGAKDVMQRLQDNHSIDVVPVAQGPLSMNAPSRAFDSQVADLSLRHGDNPILRWQASRVRTASDTNGNIKPAKTDGRKKGARKYKIDGIVACILALNGAMSAEDDVSSYAKTGIVYA